MKNLEELYEIFDNYLKGKLDKETLVWFIGEYKSNPYIKAEYEAFLKVIHFLKNDLPDNKKISEILSAEIIGHLVRQCLDNPELAPFFEEVPMRENMIRNLFAVGAVRSVKEIKGLPKEAEGIKIDRKSPSDEEKSISGYISFTFNLRNIPPSVDIATLLELELNVFDNREMTSLHLEKSLQVEGDRATAVLSLPPGLYYWIFSVNKIPLFGSKFYVIPVSAIGEITESKT